MINNVPQSNILAHKAKITPTVVAIFILHIVIALCFIALGVVGNAFDGMIQEPSSPMYNSMILAGLALLLLNIHMVRAKIIVPHYISVALIIVASVSFIIIDGSSDISMMLPVYIVVMLLLTLRLRKVWPR